MAAHHPWKSLYGCFIPGVRPGHPELDDPRASSRDLEFDDHPGHPSSGGVDHATETFAVKDVVRSLVAWHWVLYSHGNVCLGGRHT